MQSGKVVLRGVFGNVTLFCCPFPCRGSGKEKPMAEVKAKENDVALVKVINGTVYRVKVHFNENAKETMEDKIVKLMIQDLRNSVPA